MAQEQTVQGAAKKITGLLNPDKGQSEPAKPAEPSEQPQEIKEETSQESQSKSEETPKEVATENTEIKEETQTEVEEPELHRVKVQGQELEVSLDELKAGYSRDSDYRQKTHSLGLEKKDLESRREETAKDLSASVLARYNRILSARNGLAVVSLEGRSCGGCGAALPPQLVAEVKTLMTIQNCSICTRFLFWEKPE